MNTAYFDGILARIFNAGIDSNPYHEIREFSEWERGWKAEDEKLSGRKQNEHICKSRK